VSDSINPYYQLFELLKKNRMTFASAESCTGGLISRNITEIPGSSEVFWGAFVTYSNESKIKMLKIDPVVLESYGAVSRETVLAMVQGVFTESSVSCSVSVSGIAGPGGGTVLKPVGTVWICAAIDGVASKAVECHFDGDRSQIQEAAAETAILMLYNLILDNRTIDSK
jgi:PncC family amidohydrolase